MKKTTRLIAILTPFACIAATSAVPQLASGLWQTTTTIGGEKPIVTTRCRANRAMEMPPIGSTACSALRTIMANGMIDVARQCPGHIAAVIGRYTPTTMMLRASGVELIPGRSTTMTITSTRIGECVSE